MPNPLSPALAKKVTAAKWAGRTIAPLLLAVLTGCSALAPQSPGNTHMLNATGTWQANGKIALRSDQPLVAAVLSFQWAQRGEDYRATLSGPLGLGRLVLQQQRGQFTLSHGEQLLAHADTPTDAAQLLQQHSGWALPLEQLPHWLAGQPAPTQPSQQLITAAHGGTVAFLQSGWQLHYHYDPTDITTSPANTAPRPQKIIAQQRDRKITVVVKNWHQNN